MAWAAGVPVGRHLGGLTWENENWNFKLTFCVKISMKKVFWIQRKWKNLFQICLKIWIIFFFFTFGRWNNTASYQKIYICLCTNWLHFRFPSYHWAVRQNSFFVSECYMRCLKTETFFFKLSTKCFIEDVEGSILNHKIS